MSQNEEPQNPDDPRDAVIGNTEPSEKSEVDSGGSDHPGERAEAPEGAESEEYPGPSEEKADE